MDDKDKNGKHDKDTANSMDDKDNWKHDKETAEKPQSELQGTTACMGKGETDSFGLLGDNRNECIKIIEKLNEEAARYCVLASAIGTKIDGEMLRRRLRLCRIRAWDHAKHAHGKIVPVLKRSQRTQCNDELERLYRTLSACLEFLEQQYYTTLLLEAEFSLQADKTFISAGLSEFCLPKRSNDKMIVDRLPGTDVLSVKSFGSTDLRNTSDRDDLHYLQRELEDIHSLLYSMNQAIAIQSWEIEPDLETEKFTSAQDTGEFMEDGQARVNISECHSHNNDFHRIRCVTVFILVVVITVICAIFGILLGSKQS